MAYLSIKITFGLHRPALHLGKYPKQEVSFSEFAYQQIQACRDEQRFRCAENYLTALKSLQRFCQKQNIMLSDITPGFLHDYQTWLRQQGITMNTVSCYLRSLRALYNKVENNHEANPFSDVFTGKAKTEKRSVDAEVLCRLKELELPADSSLSLARDLFLFSFYTQGMPFVDMAHLQRHQVVDNLIVYERHKTGQRVVVRLEDCMKEIIGHYEHRESKFVFPILIDNETEGQAYKHYQSQLRSYNRNLHRLAKMVGSECRLTSYVARHTWASIAYDSSVDLAVISSALGHTSPNTTLIYIREINNRRIAEANEKVIDRAMNHPA
jgi:integrase/recombinase XerD